MLPLGLGSFSVWSQESVSHLDHLGYSRLETWVSFQRSNWQDREYRDCYQGLGLGDYQSFGMEALGAAIEASAGQGCWPDDLPPRWRR